MLITWKADAGDLVIDVIDVMVSKWMAFFFPPKGRSFLARTEVRAQNFKGQTPLHMSVEWGPL